MSLRRESKNFIIHKTLGFCMPEIQERIWKWQFYKTSFPDLFLVKVLRSEGSLSQGLYTFDFSVLLYCVNDQVSLLNYWSPGFCKLRTWHTFPLERNVPSLCWTAGDMLVQDVALWFPVLESKHITKCAQTKGRKRALTVFGEKSRFTSGFSFFLSLGIFSSN